MTIEAMSNAELLEINKRVDADSFISLSEPEWERLICRLAEAELNHGRLEALLRAIHSVIPDGVDVIVRGTAIVTAMQEAQNKYIDEAEWCIDPEGGTDARD